MTLNTPKYNTSKILILCNMGVYVNNTTNQVKGDFQNIRRNTTIRTASGGELDISEIVLVPSNQ